ncbi:MAG: hypothetical protein FWD97_09375 [Defluviitaleaceae bacterium]|nr:hypothetical protein [Defluviitaleaceae bacterium]
MSQPKVEKIYIDNEITKYMTSKKLLAFSDRLNPAPFTNYARIHAKGDIIEGGRRAYSTIGILASDFSGGKGEKNIKAEANISPAEARYIFQRVQMGLGAMDGVIFSSEKIFGNPNAQGYSTVRKLNIGRSVRDGKGEYRKAPWYVVVENGVGIKAYNGQGGSYCQSGSYKRECQVLVYLTDQDFYCDMAQVVAFIDVWEITHGTKLIRDGRVALDSLRTEQAVEQNSGAQTPQSNHHNHPPQTHPQASHQIPPQEGQVQAQPTEERQHEYPSQTPPSPQLPHQNQHQVPPTQHPTQYQQANVTPQQEPHQGQSYQVTQQQHQAYQGQSAQTPPQHPHTPSSHKQSQEQPHQGQTQQPSKEATQIDSVSRPQQPPQPMSQQEPPPQPTSNQPQRPAQPQTTQSTMTLEQARAVIISTGNHKGKTLGQYEKEYLKGVAWYAETYSGNDEHLREGARIIVAASHSQKQVA